MTSSEIKVVESGIRQLRLRVCEQKEAFKLLQDRFPGAFLDCLDEVLNRFEARLKTEIAFDRVQSGPSLLDSRSGPVKNN